MDLFALGLVEEASPDRVFKRFHDAMVVGEKGFILVKGLVVESLAPFFYLFSQYLLLFCTIVVWGSVYPKNLLCFMRWEYLEVM